MKTKILFLAIIISSCRQAQDNTTASQTKVAYSIDKDSVTLNFGDSSVKISKPTDGSIDIFDTIQQKNFWDSVVIPIIKKDNKRILSTIQLTVTGDWTHMVNMKKDEDKVAAVDFKDNYTRLLTKDFIDILSEQTFENVGISHYNDTTYYSFSVGRDDLGGEFEGSVRFNYIKVNSKYILTSVLGAGGNFYDYKAGK